MKDAFPELETQREFIGKMVRLEEERFGNTLTVGLKELKHVISKLKVKEATQLNFLEKAISGEITSEKFDKSFNEVKEFLNWICKSMNSLICSPKQDLTGHTLSKLNEVISLFQDDEDDEVSFSPLKCNFETGKAKRKKSYYPEPMG